MTNLDLIMSAHILNISHLPLFIAADEFWVAKTVCRLSKVCILQGDTLPEEY